MPKIRLLVFESCIVSPETTVVTCERVEVDAVGVDEAGPERPERVEALAVGELPQRRLELRAAPGDVVEAGVGAHRGARGVAGRAVDALADHDRELALVVGAGLLARDHDRLAVPDQRRRPLGEDHRHIGDGELGLLGVVAVVEADADQLAGHHGMRERDGVERRALALGGRERRPRLARRHEAPGPGRAGVDDRLVLEPADAEFAGRAAIADCLHRCPSS